MTRKARRVSGVINRRLNMRLTLDVEDIKNSTQEIAMMGQYSVNVVNFVEEAKKVVSDVCNEAKVRLRLVRSQKGVMRVKFEGLDVCSLLKAEGMEGRVIGLNVIYNIVRFVSLEGEGEEELRRRCKEIGGTLLSMGIEIDEDL